MTSFDKIVFENTTDGLICLDSNGCIGEMNSAAESLVGTRAKARGKTFWESFPDSRTPEAESALSGALAGRRPLRFDLFFPLRYSWASILAIPVPSGGAILFLRNISDRVRLLQSEAVQEGVRSIIEVVPVAISITRGPEHRMEMVNAKGRELIGHRDIVGITIRAAFPELEGQTLFEILDEVYASGVPYEGREVPVKYRPGDSEDLRNAWFDISYHTLRDTGGAISGLLSVSVDVTEQVNARLELEARLAESA